jgi:adenylate kinase
LQDPPYLEYFAEGRNRIPCIHVKDLALFVAKVAERPPTLNYIFAIDHNANAQQKRIVRAISKGVGTGEIKSVPRTNTEERYEDVFTIDLRMRPTKAFDAFIEEAANQEDPADDAEVKPEKYTFDWWCKEGIQKNIDKINKEFNKLIKLEAVRIFITGPPAVGKSFYAAQ